MYNLIHLLIKYSCKKYEGNFGGEISCRRFEETSTQYFPVEARCSGPTIGADYEGQ